MRDIRVRELETGLQLMCVDVYSIEIGNYKKAG